MKRTIAHCHIVTSQPGMKCPLCGVNLQPLIGHTCSKEEAPTVKSSPRKVPKLPRKEKQ